MCDDAATVDVEDDEGRRVSRLGKGESENKHGKRGQPSHTGRSARFRSTKPDAEGHVHVQRFTNDKAVIQTYT